MASSRNLVTLLASVLITLLVFFYAYVNIDFPSLLAVFRRADWLWLFFAFASYIANYAVRALRFNILLPAYRIPFKKMWAITGIYGMYNYLMPVKSGELSFVAMSAKKLGVDISQSAAVLIVTRLFDLIVIALFLPFVLVIFWSDLSFPLIVTFVFFCFITFVSMVCFIYWLKGFSLSKQNKSAGGDGKIARMLDELKTGMYVVEQRKLYLPLLLNTIIIWLLICLNFYCIVIALGYNIGFGHAVVISIFMVPATLLPIQGFANAGTHELGWVAAFALFQYPESISLNIAVSSHGILLVFVLLLGMVGFILDASLGNPSS